MLLSRSLRSSASAWLALAVTACCSAEIEIHFAVPNSAIAGGGQLPAAAIAPPPQMQRQTQLAAGRPGGAGGPLAISVGQDGRNVFVSLDQPQADVTVHIRNLTSATIKLTHLAFGFAGVYAPIKTIELPPAGSADLPLLVDLQHVHLPYSTWVCLRGVQGLQKITEQALVTITSKEVVVFDQRTLVWQAGEPPTAKIVRLVSAPAGLKAKDVLVVGAFKAELKGDTITVTPTSTVYPSNGRLALGTEPRDPHPTTVTLMVQGPVSEGAGISATANATPPAPQPHRKSTNS